MILFLLACGSTMEPLDRGTFECPIDPCADLPSEADGIACCVERHGYGLDDEYDRDRLADRCVGDECDDARYISEAAAVCAAQVCGLASGVGVCAGSFEFGHGEGWWIVMNVTEECDGNLCGGGDIVQVDAATGTCDGFGSWMS
jgi:hypothetical protein